MISSACICSPREAVEFEETIVFHDETVFKRFEGTVIGKCSNCGVLRTFPAKENDSYNPVQSRAGFYEQKAETFRGIFAPIVEAIYRLKKTGRVLDVGCSSGILLELLKERGFDVYGIEPHTAAYQAAHAKLGARIFHGIASDYIQQHKERFDVIIYNHVLEHIPDPVGEIVGIKRLLGPDGVLVIGVPNTYNIIFKLRGKFWEPLMPNEHIWHFSSGYMKELLRKHGYEVIGVRYEDDKRRDYPFLKRSYFGILSLLNSIAGTGEAMLICSRFMNQP